MPNSSRRPRDIPGQERWERPPQTAAEREAGAAVQRNRNSIWPAPRSMSEYEQQLRAQGLVEISYHNDAARGQGNAQGAISARPGRRPPYPGSAGGGGGMARISNTDWSAGGSGSWGVSPPSGVSGESFQQRLQGLLRTAAEQEQMEREARASTELPKPTKSPRNAIAAAVDDALNEMRAYVHTRHHMVNNVSERHMSDPYMQEQYRLEQSRQMSREFLPLLEKKVTFRAEPADWGSSRVDASVVIMSTGELHRLGEQIAQKVIAECVKQGYFR